jgi:hypothetical protein
MLIVLQSREVESAKEFLGSVKFKFVLGINGPEPGVGIDIFVIYFQVDHVVGMSIAVPFGMVKERQFQHCLDSVRLTIPLHQQVDPYLHFDILEFLGKHVSCKSFCYFV